MLRVWIGWFWRLGSPSRMLQVQHSRAISIVGYLLMQLAEAAGQVLPAGRHHQANQSTLPSAHVRLLQSRGRGESLPAPTVARTQLARYHPDLRASGSEECREGDGGHELMNRTADRLQPARRAGPPSHNPVVLPATLLRYQPQLQQLADVLPVGTMIVVLGPQHRLMTRALTAPVESGRSAHGRR
jgi:hypothetical protein